MSTGVSGVCVIVSQLCEWPPQTVFSLSCVRFSLYDHHHSTHRIANAPHLSYHLRYRSSHNARLTAASHRSLFGGSYPCAQQDLCLLPPLQPPATTSHHHSASIPISFFRIFIFVCFSFKLYPVTPHYCGQEHPNASNHYIATHIAVQPREGQQGKQRLAVRR